MDKNLQEVWQKLNMSGIFSGTDAQVEVKPKQEPFVGSGTRLSRGSTTRYYELDSKFEILLMEWIAKHGIKQTSWTFGSRMNTNCRSGRSLTTLRCPSGGKQEVLWQQIAVRTSQITGQ